MQLIARGIGHIYGRPVRPFGGEGISAFIELADHISVSDALALHKAEAGVIAISINGAGPDQPGLAPANARDFFCRYRVELAVGHVPIAVLALYSGRAKGLPRPRLRGVQGVFVVQISPAKVDGVAVAVIGLAAGRLLGKDDVRGEQIGKGRIVSRLFRLLVNIRARARVPGLAVRLPIIHPGQKISRLHPENHVQ